jgi:hypothetical protein
MQMTFKTFNPLTGSKPVVPLIDVARALIKKYKIKNTPKFNKDLFNKFIWLAADQVFVNFENQRIPDMKHIAKLMGKFDPILCTPLICVYRTDLNRYHVCDGLQHGTAMLVTYFGCVANGLQVPVWYTTADNDEAERKIFLSINRDRLPVAKIYIHRQEVAMKVKLACDVEKLVRSAGAHTAPYGSTAPGAVTHIGHLYSSYKQLGPSAVREAIMLMRKYFPNDTIHIDTMQGIALVLKLLADSDKLTDKKREDIGLALSQNFKDANRVHLDIKEEFDIRCATDTSTNRNKVAAGIISCYEQQYKKRIGVDQPVPLAITISGQY